jgi:hypothetical protein
MEQIITALMKLLYRPEVIADTELSESLTHTIRKLHQHIAAHRRIPRPASPCPCGACDCEEEEL